MSRDDTAKAATPIRFNTGMYGTLAAHHALVFEGMQNELEATLALAQSFKTQMEAALQQRDFHKEQAQTAVSMAEELRKENAALKEKATKNKAIR